MIRVTFVVVVVLLRVFQAAAQERGYLAIDEQGGRHAFSFRGQADAVNICGTTACEVVASFASCLGVAQSSPTPGQDVWTWMEAATEADARVGALNECTAAGGPACEVLNVYCVDASAVEAALELDQSTRRRIQQGLGSAGFDAGLADGLFGPRTRQAIRQWQASRGAWATGYLTGAQVEALPSPGGLPPQMPAGAPAGSRVGGTGIPSSGSRVSGASVPASGSRVSGTSPPAVGAAPGADVPPRPRGAGFSPDQTCAGKPAGAACWMEIAQQPGCYVWNSSLATGASVTWTGECVGGLAQGTGTLTWISDGNQQTNTGRLQDGRMTGSWVVRYADGDRRGRPLCRRRAERQLGPPLRGREPRGRPHCRRQAERQLGPPLRGRGRRGCPICQRRNRVDNPAALGGVRFRGGQPSSPTRRGTLPSRPPIRVTAEPAGVHVAILVTDEGRGVPPEQLPHLFRM